MPETFQKVRGRTPEPIRRFLGFVWKGISYAVVRPESERLFAIITQPALESNAYLSRALRDLQLAVRSLEEAHLDAPSLGLLELAYAVRATVPLAPGAAIAVIGERTGLLPGALTALGYAPVKTSEAGASASFDAVVRLGMNDVAEFKSLRSLVATGALLVVTAQDLNTEELEAAGWRLGEVRSGQMTGSGGWRLATDSTPANGLPGIVLATAFAR